MIMLGTNQKLLENTSLGFHQFNEDIYTKIKKIRMKKCLSHATEKFIIAFRPR